MLNRSPNKAPIIRSSTRKLPVVRLPPKSNLELFLARGAQTAIMFIGLVAFVFALSAGEYILAPIAMGVVIGLMFGPVASMLEARGMPSGFSALVVSVLFVMVIGFFALAVATPLSVWASRVPRIWEQLQSQLSHFKGFLEWIRAAREELRNIGGDKGLTVSIDEGSPVETVAMFAPSLGAQVLIFLATLYFFVASRHQTRIAILKLCFTRRLRWRVAHILRDIEALVSRYLLSITLINLTEGTIVASVLWLIGIPSALLWGALAVLAPFIAFFGPLLMTVVLFAVGLAEFDTLSGALIPPLAYQVINIVEAQFLTPIVIGHAMMLNPFIVVLALIFWIWLWGPLGGFIAIPAVLACYAVIRSIFPGADRIELK